MGWGYWGAYIFISGYVTLGFGGYLHALTGLPATHGILKDEFIPAKLELRSLPKMREYSWGSIASSAYCSVR